MKNEKRKYPIAKPELTYYHEKMGAASFGAITEGGEEITERVTCFTETDADKRPEYPEGNWYMPRELTFEEYSEILKPVFQMKKKGGIIEARVHTGGDSLVWGMTPHAYIHKMFEYVSNDRDAEVLIFGGSGDNYFKGIGRHPEYCNTDEEWVDLPETDPRYNWTLYDHQYYDGTSDIEYQVNCPIPTIGVWNGGGFHSDLFLFNDITLATEDAWTTEMHFRVNMVPGDGVQIAWRELMGRKRFAYAELTGQVITAKMALEYGMINEICKDVDAAYDRAWEIAELIMHSGTRQTRRLTVQQLRKCWREDVANELKPGFATEMWNTATEDSPHSNVYWQGAIAEAKATMEAEKKGKVVRPRMGKFIEEDPIK